LLHGPIRSNKLDRFYRGREKSREAFGPWLEGPGLPDVPPENRGENSASCAAGGEIVLQAVACSEEKKHGPSVVYILTPSLIWLRITRRKKNASLLRTSIVGPNRAFSTDRVLRYSGRFSGDGQHFASSSAHGHNSTPPGRRGA